MPDISLETFAELSGVAAELAAMVLLSAIGLFAERAGFASLTSGPEPITFWLLAVGAVALYAGLYMVGYRRLLVRVQAAMA